MVVLGHGLVVDLETKLMWLILNFAPLKSHGLGVRHILPVGVGKETCILVQS